jgi:predicted nucleic acid-binding protein
MAVLGCIGVLEAAFRLHLLTDLSEVYRQLISAGAYIDRKILANSLSALHLPPM